MQLSELEDSWRAQAQSLLEAPEDAAFIQLGKLLPTLPGEPLGAVPRPDLIIARARKWIEVNKQSLCSAMRKSQTVRQFMRDRNTYDGVNAVVAIAAAILAHLTQTVIPVPVSVAVILFRLGVENVCGKDWAKP